MQKKDLKYSIGLDLGVSTIGWAVVDEEDNLVTLSGKKLWGVRLFSEAQKSSDRRMFRSQKRNKNKKIWRLNLLKDQLKDFVLNEDSNFYKKLSESYMKKEEHTLFNGNYNDASFYREFPTVYHLRQFLKDENKVKDYKNRGIYYRLLYLACSDILKNRGNFLYSVESFSNLNSPKLIISFVKEVISYVNEGYDVLDSEIVLSQIKKYIEYKETDKLTKKDSNTIFVRAILGKEFDIYKMLQIEGESEKIDFSKPDWDVDKKIDDETFEILNQMYQLYSRIKIFHILGESKNISENKIKIYEKHKKELKKLKEDIKKIDKLLNKNYYDFLFVQNSEGKAEKGSYTLYIGKYLSEGKKVKITKEKEGYTEFIKKLKKIKEEIDKAYPENDLLNYINDNFLERPTNSDNRLLPYSLHFNELEDILYVFVKQENSEKNKEISNNIKKILEFKVPYFVGSLTNTNKKDDTNYWVVKNKGYENEKITPLNFDLVVDKQKTNEKFIKNMLRSCTFLEKEFCIKKESILYQDYIFYNTINKMRFNDVEITKQQKEILYNFLLSGKNLTKSAVIKLMNLEKDAEISLFTEKNSTKPIPISLSAKRNFNMIFEGEKNNGFYQKFYDEVIAQISFIDVEEKELRKKIIKEIAQKYKTINISEFELEKLSKIKSTNWGNLSQKFLEELNFEDENGVVDTMINILKNSNRNIMEIISFGNNKDVIDCENGEKENIETNSGLHDYLKKKYVSPMARRTIIQANLIVDEIVKIMGGQKPENISIEFTREKVKNGKMTDSRYDKINNLYTKIKKELKNECVESLIKTLEDNKDKVKGRKFYLYFMQLGKDAYTGENISFDDLIHNPNKYNIDHIFPKSKIYIDEIDNTVLTSSVINGDKNNIYPLPVDVRNKMKKTWDYLKEKGLISSSKYDRLVRSTPLTDRELEDFINRQKTTLDWINIVCADILSIKYNEENKKDFILYSKSRHVSEFRNMYDILKVRNLNDLHHAHDAYLNIIISRKIKKNLYINTEGQFRTYNYKRILSNKLQEKVPYIKKIFKYHDVFVTKKIEFRNKGEFWNQNIQPKNEKSTALHPIKKGMDTKVYGGYVSMSTAFYAIIELNQAKKFVPITTHECSNFYDEDKLNKSKFEKYLKNKISKDIKILFYPLGLFQLMKVKNNVVRFGNKYDDKNINLYNTTQLIISESNQKYLREIIKIRNKEISKEIKELNLDVYDININDNIKLFTEIYNKVTERFEKHNSFNKLIYEKIKISENPIEYFASLYNEDQYRIIVEIIEKLLTTNKSGDGNLNGKTLKSLHSSVNIKYQLSIIKESVTGFFTKEITINE